MLKRVIRKVPIPTAGVALGLVAAGILVMPYAALAANILIACSVFMVIMLFAKLCLFPEMAANDFKNSIFASVFATLFMALMQLASCLAPFAFVPAFALWSVSILAHFVLMGWFAVRYLAHFKLKQVFPTYFITYVGIIVAAATSPAFGMEQLGIGLFWFGFICVFVLFSLITLRYAKISVPEPAKPLFCIYAAPFSLSLAGYLSASADPNVAFATVLLVAAQLCSLFVITKLPTLLRLQFYPSYAAMTFPFVVTATALGKTLKLYAALDVWADLPAWIPVALDVLFAIEAVFALAMVIYVFVRYLVFFFTSAEVVNTPAQAAEQAELEAPPHDAI